ncbi:hypothetical protein QGP82_10385 [Leptothoe sp. LEGE 181152]|nr:hypothetical protein [Leptothoe sp. LEGE 181152]
MQGLELIKVKLLDRFSCFIKREIPNKKGWQMPSRLRGYLAVADLGDYRASKFALSQSFLD